VGNCNQGGIGKLAGVARLLSDFDALIAGEGFKHLSMSHRHAILAGGFSVAHRDPFDRMLVAQAMSESAVLLSNDAELSAFGVARRLLADNGNPPLEFATSGSHVRVIVRKAI
jgi:PIN domain nuclease of toxin-antitoxin system